MSLPYHKNVPGQLIIECSVKFDPGTSVSQVMDIVNHFDRHYLLPGYELTVHHFCRNRFGEALSLFGSNKHVQCLEPVSYHVNYWLVPVKQSERLPVPLISLFQDKIQFQNEIQ